ncbi:MAG TPA: hypothetical protein VGK41_01805 [Solirubrobacterales bacterium]
MAAWPDEDELAQVLNVDNAEDWETTLERVLSAAIAQVKADIGYWDEGTDVPTDAQAQAALRMAELISARPTEPVAGLAADPTYRTLLTGSRRVFGIA